MTVAATPHVYPGHGETWLGPGKINGWNIIIEVWSLEGHFPFYMGDLNVPC